MMLRRFHRDETGQGLIESVLAVAMLTSAVVSSMKNDAIPELVIGACILIALAFVVFWLLDRN
jgi:Flp pilus assembly pilin Flp